MTPRTELEETLPAALLGPMEFACKPLLNFVIFPKAALRVRGNWAEHVPRTKYMRMTEAVY